MSLSARADGGEGVASEVVDGLTIPLRLAGDPALELCNTRTGWALAQPKEYLTSYAHLAVWSREAGLLSPAAATRLRTLARTHRDEAADVLADVHDLRDATYALLVGRPGRDDWAVLARHAQAAREAQRLVPPGPRSRTGAWHLDPNRLDAPLLAAAAAVADYVTADPYVPVGRCGGTGCGWVFADPYGRRRWCSMALCGNREKVRRHADRRRSA
jgi:predicted RNA-binding Zn ribbon-like protein